MKPQCTTAAECLRELARVMEQFGIDTALAAINSTSVKFEDICSAWIYDSMPTFSMPEKWRFAIAEVEGKPVFIGDELYDVNNGTKHKIANGICSASDWSWNPPRPKTVMVEMTVEDAEHWAKLNGMMQMATCRLSIACKKALEELN